jgi:hypothetical protein
MWIAAAAVLLTPSLTDASTAAGGPAQCTAAQQTVRLLLPELERSIKPDGMKAAEAYVAKPPPATSPEKAWGDFAAGISLAGERQLAAWAGLKATMVRWNGETVANAGVYVFRLGKPREALTLLECAHASGYRSPYLQEALSTVNHKLGRAAEARTAIDEAQKMAPEDELIEVAASFIKTGKPPPARPAPKDDYDETLREVQAHADRVLATLKAQATAIQAAVPSLNAMAYYDIKEKYLRTLVGGLANRIAPLRTAGGEARMRDARVNDFSIFASATYTQITDTLLDFPNTIGTNGSPLLFWSEVLSLDPPVLARELEDAGRKWGSDGSGSLAQPPQDRYRSEKSANDRTYDQRRFACKTTECTIHVKGDWCLQWKPIHDRWIEGSRQRLNPAARRFDQVATRTMADVEVELLDAQDFSLRQYARMRFWQVPGVDMQQQHAQVINSHLKLIYEKHVASPGRGASGYLGQRAKWFAGHRAHVERELEWEGKSMQQQCAPALRALLELLIEEEWQAYLAHLREKALWGIQGQMEGEFVCEATIGPVTVSIDLDKPGSGKMDIKWSPSKKLPGSIKISGTVSEDQEFGVNVAYGGSHQGDGASGSVGTAGADGRVSYGGYRGKGKATLITVSSPYDKRKYTGIKIKTSGGFGVGGKNARGACYPSSGSVTFVPRAILENGVKYINSPSRAPRS